MAKDAEGNEIPASVAAANARTAARAASMPQVDPNTIDPADPAGLNRAGGPSVPAPPAAPPAGGQPPAQTTRQPVRFVSRTEETPAAPPNRGEAGRPQGTPEPGEVDVAKLTRTVEELRRKVESGTGAPPQPPPPEFNFEDTFARNVREDPDIRSCAQEFNANVAELKALVAVDEDTGQPVIIQGHYEGPLRKLEFELETVNEQIKTGKGAGGVELDEDQIAALRDRKADLRDEYAEKKETVRSLHGRQRVLSRYYKERVGEIRGDLERKVEEQDREAREGQRQEEAERVFDATLTDLLQPFGITPESDAYGRQERKLGLMLSALRDEQGKDFDDLAKTIKDVFDAEIAPDLSEVAGARDAEAARRKAAEVGQPHPTGAAAHAGPGDTSKMSSRERRIAAGKRTATLVRDVRMVGG